MTVSLDAVLMHVQRVEHMYHEKKHISMKNVIEDIIRVIANFILMLTAEKEIILFISRKSMVNIIIRLWKISTWLHPTIVSLLLRCVTM